MTDQHISEEQLVDYVLGHLPDNEKEKIKYHLTVCRTCEAEWRHWQHLLAEKTYHPSPVLKRQIINSIEEKTTPVQPKRKKWRRSAVLAMTVASTILLGLGLLRMIDAESEQQGFVMAQHDEIPKETIEKKTGTNHLKIVPVVDNTNMTGGVWLNQSTNEMILHVDGLVPLHTNNYQLWLIHKNDDWNGELLNLRDGSIRVYYKGADIALLKYIKVSVEPPGGSLKPSGPEAFYVDLEKQTQ
ncbi:MAG TPA: anti-sigma factor [Bacillota bacterium]|nr:anti-sigma factor [Bacillota bacterium]